MIQTGNANRKKLIPCAVFDFDGTLTYKETFMTFIKFSVGNKKFIKGFIKLIPDFVLLLLRLIPNWRMKEKVIKHFFGGWTEDLFLQNAESFLREEIKSKFRNECVNRLKWHKGQRHLIVIVSATLEAYLISLSDLLGVDHIIGTKLEILNGRITGKILGKNCYGAEKVVRLRELLGDLNQYYIYAYGDSRGDRELLEISDSPYFNNFG